MNIWYAKNQGIVWIGTILLSLIAYAMTTFATVEYVDKKHVDVVGLLTEIKVDVKDTRDKVYNLRGEVPPVR